MATRGVAGVGGCDMGGLVWWGMCDPRSEEKLITSDHVIIVIQYNTIQLYYLRSRYHCYTIQLYYLRSRYHCRIIQLYYLRSRYH